MAWIEYHTALRDHWKIKRLSTILEVEYITALGAVSCLWLWAAEYAKGGYVTKFTDLEIRDAARCNLEKMTLDALKKCELIDNKGRINDWNEHGLKLLVSSRKRMKKYRERLRNRNATVTSTIPNHTIPNHTNNNIAEEIYGYYAKIIKAGAKEDAIRNINKLLKTGVLKDELLGRIYAYKAQLIKRPTDFIIQANNFFGKSARYKDFEPIKIVNYLPPDPDCRLCRGQGKIQNGEGQVMRCNCVKEHP